MGGVVFGRPGDEEEDDGEDIEEFDRVAPQVIEVYSVLLEEAKKANPDDPVLASLKPLREPIAAGSLRALVGQVRLAIDR